LQLFIGDPVHGPRFFRYGDSGIDEQTFPPRHLTIFETDDPDLDDAVSFGVAPCGFEVDHREGDVLPRHSRLELLAQALDVLNRIRD
jgi:hypothetical protein